MSSIEILKEDELMLKVVNSLDETSTPYIYKEEDSMDTFVETLSRLKVESLRR